MGISDGYLIVWHERVLTRSGQIELGPNIEPRVFDQVRYARFLLHELVQKPSKDFQLRIISVADGLRGYVWSKDLQAQLELRKQRAVKK